MQKEIENKQENKRIIAQQISYQSPLPPPEVLQKYNQIQPGLVEKIIELTETQANHRRALEDKQLEAQVQHWERRDREAKLGQIFAFIISVCAIGGGVYVALNGYQWAGTIISALGLGSIVTAFIKGRETASKSEQ